jgi:hypothetical protein
MAIAITPASGSITAVDTACRINVTGATMNDSRGYDVLKYPTEPLFEYYLSVVKAGQDTLKSQIFNVAADGSFEFNSLSFPTAGTYAIHLVNASNDVSVEHIDVTVA